MEECSTTVANGAATVLTGTTTAALITGLQLSASSTDRRSLEHDQRGSIVRAKSFYNRAVKFRVMAMGSIDHGE